ncbi:MAG: Smr/MutS family protein [Alphaproteobacteria bacterium]
MAGTGPQVPPEPSSGRELDAATDRRLRRGQLAIEGRLDLHGHTQAEGYAELAEFIANSHEAGQRCLLVITGRGDVAGERGVLRRNLPQWLGGPSLRPYVLGVSPAQPKHGGLGAFYVLLRKGRSRR